MEYNTSQPRLIIPEYGRNVQKMVDYLSTIENREERNLQTQNLIEIIGNLNPQIRDVSDFKHKLWDHLFIMSDFKLDVDSPYPVPVPETLMEKPKEVEYPTKSGRYRHYGNVLKDMLTHCLTLEEGEYRDRLVNAVANHMKKTYLIWNRDTVENDVILKEITNLTDGKLDLSKVVLLEQKEIARTFSPTKRTNPNTRSNNRNNKRKKFVKSNK